MLSKAKLCNILKYFAKLFDPRPVLKYSLRQMNRHKWIYITLTILVFIPTVFADRGIDLSWADPTRDLNFIGSMDEITVSLSDTYGLYAQGIYDLMLPVGQALAVLFWLTQFGEVMMRQDLTPEHILLQFIKISFYLVVMGYGWEILGYLFDFFNDCFTLLSGPGGALGDITNTASLTTISFNGLTDVPWYECVPLILELGLFQVFKMFCMLITSLIVWTRKLKLLVYAALAPIGVSDFLGGTKSASLRYVKKLIALGIQGMIMYTIAFIGNALIIDGITAFAPTSASGSTDYVELIKNGDLVIFTFLIAAIPPALAMIAAFNKSEEISNGIIGA